MFAEENRRKVVITKYSDASLAMVPKRVVSSSIAK